MYTRSLGTVSASESVDVLIVSVTPGALEFLGVWLSQNSSHLVKGHVTIGVFVYLKLCAGFITAGSSDSLIESPSK